jgi:hypothetical protein
VPDTDGLTADAVAAAECADPRISLQSSSSFLANVPGVAGVLRNFHTLDLLTEGSTVSEFVVNIRHPSRPIPETKSYLTPYLPVIPTSGNQVSK